MQEVKITLKKNANGSTYLSVYDQNTKHGSSVILNDFDQMGQILATVEWVLNGCKPNFSDALRQEMANDYGNRRYHGD